MLIIVNAQGTVCGTASSSDEAKRKTKEAAETHSDFWPGPFGPVPGRKTIGSNADW